MWTHTKKGSGGRRHWGRDSLGGEAWGSGNQSTKRNYILPSPSPRRNDLPKSSLSSVSTKSLSLVVFWGFSATDVFDDESQTLDLVLMMVSFGTLCFLFQIVGTQISVSSEWKARLVSDHLHVESAGKAMLSLVPTLCDAKDILTSTLWAYRVTTICRARVLCVRVPTHDCARFSLSLSRLEQYCL